MHLINIKPISSPLEGEQMVEQLWQNASFRRFSLFIIGSGGDGVKLGIAARDADLEESLASLIADFCGEEKEPSILVEHVHASPEVAAINLHHIERHIAVEGGGQFGWQRADPLRGAYAALDRLEDGVIAGLGLVLRPLPVRGGDMAFQTSMSCFATGRNAAFDARRVASTLSAAGVQLRRPLRQRRAVSRIVDGEFRRPLTVEPLNVIARFWHPPYAARQVSINA